MHYLIDILQPTRLTEIVDIGANPIDGLPPYQPMLDLKICHITGFEPQKNALDELLKNKSQFEKYLPYAVGDGNTHTLNICAWSGMTSLLTPDFKTLEYLGVLKDNAQIIDQVELETRKLDDIEEIQFLDFLKIDIQGSELSVLQHGREKFKNTVTIQIEVSFLTIYENQASFSDIDLELRKQGFIPHCFETIKNWPISPFVYNQNPTYALNQVLEADVVYVKNFMRPELLDDEQIKQLAIISHICYKSYDLSLKCILQLVERNAISTNSAEHYVQYLNAELAQ